MNNTYEYERFDRADRPVLPVGKMTSRKAARKATKRDKAKAKLIGRQHHGAHQRRNKRIEW